MRTLSAWKLVLAIALGVLAHRSASAGLMPGYDKEYLWTSEHGWIGIGERSELDASPGLGVEGNPTKTTIDVYFGEALRVALPGSVVFWSWAGPGLLAVLLISLGAAWLWWKGAKPVVSVLFFSFCGSVFGLFLTFLGTGVWLPTLAVIAGSPFASFDLNLGWLFWGIVGGILPLRRFVWARRLLAVMMLLHVAGIFTGLIAGSLRPLNFPPSLFLIEFVLERLFGWTDALNISVWPDVLSLIIFAAPVAFCVWLLMYAAAQVIVWREILGRPNPWCYRPAFALALLPVLLGCVAVALISELVRVALRFYV